jgi:hypothetical protein
VREQIASAFDLIVHLDRLADGGRKVVQISEVQGMEGDVIVMQDIFRYIQTGVKNGRVEGYFTATGVRPKFMDKIEAQGIHVRPVPAAGPALGREDGRQIRAVAGRGTGPATLAEVMAEEERRAARGDVAHLQPLPTGFEPLDDVLNGGLRPGELLVIGGPFGVGKTIWGLQAARNAACGDEGTVAMYVCYEHDRAHLMARLLCLESAEQGWARRR